MATVIVLDCLLMSGEMAVAAIMERTVQNTFAASNADYLCIEETISVRGTLPSIGQTLFERRRLYLILQT